MDKTKMAVEVFNNAAGVYQEKYMNLDIYNDSYDLFCSYLRKPDAAILDLACGPGNITRYLLKQHIDLNILGTDLAPNMIELAKANNPQAEFHILDCKDIKALNRKFDGIICGFGLPYLSKEEAIQLIADARDVLEPGGILYLSTMEDDYSKSEMKTSSSGSSLFMYYHEGSYLIDALEKSGFEVLHAIRQEFPSADEHKATDLILIARTIPA